MSSNQSSTNWKKQKEKKKKKKEKRGERLLATLSYSRLSILSGAYLVLLDGWTELAYPNNDTKVIKRERNSEGKRE